MKYYFNRFQVRRTDKIKEDPNSRHPIEKYFQKIPTFQNNSNFIQDKTPVVFIASDDHTVLGEARKK